MDWTHWFLAKLPAALILSAFVTVIAYIRSPLTKVFVFSLPIPFTCAYLQSGIPINGSHFTGVFLSIAYHLVVMQARLRAGIPIFAAILLGVTFYMTFALACRGAADLPVIPLVMMFVLTWLIVVLNHRPLDEGEYRTNAKPWVKFLSVFVIALGIFGMTGLLGGAVTTFPYAGVFTSYEMRYSLRTLFWRFAINYLAFVVILTIIWATQGYWPQPWPLIAGWIGFILVLRAVQRVPV